MMMSSTVSLEHDKYEITNINICYLLSYTELIATVEN